MPLALVTGAARANSIAAGIVPRLEADGWEVVTSDHTTGNLPYGASKGALDRIVISAARELGPRNISANVVNPGPIDTGWMDAETRDALTGYHPLGRMGTPRDVAGVTAFLLSEPGRWISGQLLQTDGGFSARY